MLNKNKNKILQNKSVARILEKLENYENRRSERIKENDQKIQAIKNEIDAAAAAMLAATRTGDAAAYIDAKQKHEKASEQLDFMKTFIESGKDGLCTPEEIEDFNHDIAKAFESECDELDSYLIKELEKMRVKLAEVAQIGGILSGAFQRFSLDFNPSARYRDYTTSSLGTLLAKEIYDAEEYRRASGVRMRREQGNGAPAFSDEKDIETAQIVRDLFRV